jgi:4-amino-4-deoxy-L-arabinose transferase-like glycosyltransferase
MLARAMPNSRPAALHHPSAARLKPPRNEAVWLFGGLLIYFGLQLAARVWASRSVELDEAEQLLWTQQLRLGYGPQPPLYTWVQWAFFEVLGVSVFALALLKNLLLLSTYSFTFLAARRVLTPRLAVMSTLSLMLLMQIVWESQRDLTHSVLVTTCAAATLWVLCELVRAPHVDWYALLGLTAACGLLAKYSFAVYLAALGGALLLSPDTRRVVIDRRMLLSVAIALMLVLPHGLWVLDHLGAAVDNTAGKLSAGQGRGLGQIASGLASLAFVVPSFLTPWILIVLALFGRGLAMRRADREPLFAGLFLRYFALLLAVLVAMVVIGGAANFKDRWLQPFLFLAPMAFFVLWPGLEHHARRPGLVWAAAAMGALTLVLLTLRPAYDGRRGKPDQLNLPIAALAQSVRAAGIEPAVIVSNEQHLAGALRLVFPRSRIMLAADWSKAPNNAPPAAGALLLITSEKSFAALRTADPAWSTLVGSELALPYVHASASTAPARFRYAVAEPALSGGVVGGTSR